MIDSFSYQGMEIIDMKPTTSQKDLSINKGDNVNESTEADSPTLSENQVVLVTDIGLIKTTPSPSSVQNKNSILLPASNLPWIDSLENLPHGLQFVSGNDGQSYCDSCYNVLKDGKCLYIYCHRYGL